jgi:hypothetical protein
MHPAIELVMRSLRLRSAEAFKGRAPTGHRSLLKRAGLSPPPIVQVAGRFPASREGCIRYRKGASTRVAINC